MQLIPVFKGDVSKMAEKNAWGKKRAIEPMRYVPLCDIYAEQQMLGHRVGGPTPPEGT